MELSNPKSYREVESRALNLLEGLGYHRLTPEGLCSPSFPDTFAPSVFHERIVNAMEGRGGRPPSAGIDWAFRHVDLDRAAFSPFHLSAFRMMAFYRTFPGGKGGALRKSIVGEFCDVLRLFRIAIPHCAVSIFGGGKIFGHQLGADRNSERCWKENGLNAGNLISVPGMANFTNFLRHGEPAGPRSEIFYPVGRDRFVELGTVVFEEFIVGKDDRLSSGANCVYGGAFGIERLAAARGKCDDLLELDELRPLRECLLEEMPALAPLVFSAEVRQLVDAVRTLSIIMHLTNSASWGKRRQRVNRLRGVALRSLQILGKRRPGVMIRKMAGLTAALELDMKGAAASLLSANVAEVLELR